MLPELTTPLHSRAIVNAHFKINSRIKLPNNHKFLGLIGGTADWIFINNKTISVTVSAADQLADNNSKDIIDILWKDVSRALSIESSIIPECRIVKEKRATFAQVPEALSMRPKTKTKWKNIFLSGDWTDTGLPATIEGSIRSGLNAAIKARKRAN